MKMRRVPQFLIAVLAASLPLCAQADTRPASRPGSESAPANLKDARATMAKWMETEQIISRERKDWNQGREILAGRLDVVKQEAAGLREKITAAEANAKEADKKRDELKGEVEKLKAVGATLATSVTTMEAQVRTIWKTLPDPIKTKLQPLYQRIPEDPATAKVSIAERFQNVLGILNEVNKANNEVAVSYEVHTLADGKPSEVKAIYLGLAQAYYVSAKGDAGIGRPGPDGWIWEPSKAIAPDVLLSLEIISGKHSPAFVPLPVKVK